jgi:hypothetical protein
MPTRKPSLPPAKVQAYADSNGLPPATSHDDGRPLSVRLADDAAAQIETTPDDHLGRQGYMKQVSVPMGAHELAAVEVLADRLGKSRGAMIAWAAEIGSRLIVDRMVDSEAQASLTQAIQARQDQLLAEFAQSES